MFLRALAAFLMLPGVFAGVIPALIVHADSKRMNSIAAGYPLLGIGLFLLLWCVRDFWVIGKGTLAPWDPPKRLVITGLYRITRNPMYVSITALLIGWMFVTGSRALGWYILILMIAFHLRVILYEEPRLKRQFPDDWQEYSRKVPRWLLRMPERN